MTEYRAYSVKWVEALEAEIERLEGAQARALEVARRLECMLLNGAKSKRAYHKMQGQAEFIVEALNKEST